jgi:hypothetical protein
MVKKTGAIFLTLAGAPTNDPALGVALRDSADNLLDSVTADAYYSIACRSAPASCAASC